MPSEKESKRRSLFPAFAESWQLLVADFQMLTGTWTFHKYIFSGIVLASITINLLALVFPLALLQVYDRVIPNFSVNTLIFLLIGVGVALVIEAGLKISRAYISGWADALLEYKIGGQAFEHLLRSS